MFVNQKAKEILGDYMEFYASQARRLKNLGNVKFYRYSLQQVCVLEGKGFDGFYHEIEGT